MGGTQGLTTTGAQIRRQRLRRRLTQGEVADLLGVSRAAICQWELGVDEPRLATLRALARVWGVGVHRLVGTRDAPPRKRRARDAATISAALNAGNAADEAEADAE